MTKRKTWRSKLNKSELKHLKENKIQTKDDLNVQKEFMKEAIHNFPGTMPCWECKHILIKLGMWED